MSVVKKDAENEKGLSGAEFGLYAKEDIKAGDKVLVKADELLTKAVTGEDGKAVFEQDLPFGTYYVKELAAPDGFVPFLRMSRQQLNLRNQILQQVWNLTEQH